MQAGVIKLLWEGDEKEMLLFDMNQMCQPEKTMSSILNSSNENINRNVCTATYLPSHKPSK